MKRLRLLLIPLLALVCPPEATAQSPIGTQVPADSVSRSFPLVPVLAAAGVSYGVASLTLHPLQQFDHTVSLHATQLSQGTRCPADNVLQYLPAAGVYAFKFLGMPSAHSYGGISLRLATTYASVAALTLSGKYLLVHRDRPDGSASNSFPSGHTATAFAGAEVLRLEYRQSSPLPAILGYTAATLTGALRIYNNRHWLSDVLAGAGIGILSAQFSYRLSDWLSPRPTAPSPHLVTSTYLL